jgi:hypothetical protein
MTTPAPSPEAVAAAMKWATNKRPITDIELHLLYGQSSGLSATEGTMLTLAAEVERLREELEKLKDPVAVHINLLRGTIAYTRAGLLHVLGIEGDPADHSPSKTP